MGKVVFGRGFCPWFALLGLLGVVVAGGCTRAEYRADADRESYEAIREKTQGRPWALRSGFTIEPDPRSRLFDASNPNDPRLPDVARLLYKYSLPELDGATGNDKSDANVTDEPCLQEKSDGKKPGGGDTNFSGEGDDQLGLPVAPIPGEYWGVMPRQCLARMVEFRSVREEYARYAGEIPKDWLDDARRLDLKQIVKLALMNSREYQAAKEQLYRAALALTFQRYAYVTKFSPGGNGTGIEHSRSGGDGSSQSGLDIGSTGFGIERLMSTGGTLLTRFANSVILTFNGPDGFTSDVSSELLFSFSQSMLQRDIIMEPLIQSERNLIYAARDFARFRKEFFMGLARAYYGLLRTYRNIEIESQNYFSLVRTFEQARAEVQAGVKNAPNQVSVDQFEQGMLSGRSSLISRCNVLERELDSLKLTIGLPTETPINIDLKELDRLTLYDEIEVAAERVRRWQTRAMDRRKQPLPDHAELLNANIFLIDRTLQWLELRKRIEKEVTDTSELVRLLARLRVDQARFEAERRQRLLDATKIDGFVAPKILVYQRISELIDALLLLGDLQARQAVVFGRDQSVVEKARAQLKSLGKRLKANRDRLAEILRDPKKGKLADQVTGVRAILDELSPLITQLDRLNEVPAGKKDAMVALRETLKETDALIKTTQDLLKRSSFGLTAMNIKADIAMMTALVQRLDLMNARGRLADDWRSIKLTGDDLKSVWDLRASQTIGTRKNRPFGFSLDESRTTLAMELDLPLNRRSQRNSFRSALIDYQAGRRDLMREEDQIKLDVRNGLRNLEETRLQYPISVTRAALAAEQVISIRLQLALGVQGVRGRDLLDALQDSREALIAVANSRIGFIIDRGDFALDLEVMQLDEEGMWPQISEIKYVPEGRIKYPAAAGPAYGEIPSFLKVSEELRRMEKYGKPGEVKKD